MRKYLLIFVLAVGYFFASDAKGGVPHALKYQAVIRDLKGEPLANRNDINIVISIRKNDMQGPIVYSETHGAVSSNAFGLVNLEIGRGGGAVGTFPDIAWGTSSHFLQIEVQLDNNGYTSMGVSELLSVPYALYAENAGSSQVSFVGVKQDVLPKYDTALKTLVNTTISQKSNGDIEMAGKLTVNSPSSIELNSSGKMLLNASKLLISSPASPGREYSLPSERGLDGQYLMLKKNGEMGWGDGGGTGGGGSFDPSMLEGHNVPVWDDNISRLRTSYIYSHYDVESARVDIKADLYVNWKSWLDVVHMRSAEVAEKGVFRDSLVVENIAILRNGLHLDGDLTGNNNIMTKDLPEGYIWIGDVFNKPVGRLLSGGASIAQDGTVTLKEKDPKIGTFSPSQVAYWDDISGKLEGSANLFDDGTTVSVGEDIQVGGSATVTKTLTVAAKSTLGETQVESLNIKNNYVFPNTKGLPHQFLMLNTTRDSLLWKTFVGKGGIEVKEDTLIGHTADLVMMSDNTNDTLYSILDGMELSKVGLLSYVGVWKNERGNIYNNGNLSTTKVGIGIASPLAKLHVDDGDFLITSEINNAGAAVPVNGAGDRLMWVADKAAFRVGGVSGNQWDIENVGGYSFAAGYDNVAKGDKSVALGTSNKANEEYSFALGNDNVVNAIGAIALGESNSLQGKNALVFGKKNVVLAENGLTIGYDNNNVAAARAILIGTNVSGEATNVIAVGVNAKSRGVGSIVIGSSDNGSNPALKTDADYSIAMGYNSSTESAKSIAIGYLAKVAINSLLGSSIAIGESVNASGGGLALGSAIKNSHSSISVGNALANELAATNTVNLGLKNNAKSPYGILLGSGNNTSTNATNQILVGTNNEALANYSVTIGANFRGGVANARPHSVLIGSAVLGGALSLDKIYSTIIPKAPPAFTIHSAMAPASTRWGGVLQILTQQGDLYIRKDIHAEGHLYVDSIQAKGDIHTDGDLYARGNKFTSDRRLKSNIQNLSSASTAFLDSISAVSYIFNSDEEKVLQYGFIAQDVQKYFPHLVGSRDGLLNLNYTAFVPILWKIAQDQKNEIEDLKTQVQQMQEQLEALKTLIESK